jgi:hypothetical protein
VVPLFLSVLSFINIYNTLDSKVSLDIILSQNYHNSKYLRHYSIVLCIVSLQEGKMSILHHKPSDHHQEGLLNRITKDVLAVYDWLSGPPMSEQDRINHTLEETRPLRDKNLVTML